MSYSFYTIAKTTYRMVVPRRFDRCVFDGQTALSRLIIRFKAVPEKGALQDNLYDATYYARQEEAMRASSKHIAERMPEVRTVINIDCGSGAILDAMRDRALSGRRVDRARAKNVMIFRRKDALI